MTAHVFDAHPDNFDNLVLGNSQKGLVLVHFWTPKAGPCRVLMPRLGQLAADYAGRFLMVMANTDTLGHIARRFGVTSVPTVKFFLHGEVVHTIHGAEPGSTFRAALARFIAGDDDRLRMQALKAHQEGRTEEAIGLLARAAVERPEDLAITADLAKLLLLSGQLTPARDLLGSLPAEARREPRIGQLLAHLELIHAAQHGPEDAEARLNADADDHPARLTRAARALFDDQIEAALDDLLQLAIAAPQFQDQIGHRALLALFGMLGPEHELTRRYRARLAAAKH